MWPQRPHNKRLDLRPCQKCCLQRILSFKRLWELRFTSCVIHRLIIHRSCPQTRWIWKSEPSHPFCHHNQYQWRARLRGEALWCGLPYKSCFGMCLNLSSTQNTASNISFQVKNVLLTAIRNLIWANDLSRLLTENYIISGKSVISISLYDKSMIPFKTTSSWDPPCLCTSDKPFGFHRICSDIVY